MNKDEQNEMDRLRGENKRLQEDLDDAMVRIVDLQGVILQGIGVVRLRIGGTDWVSKAKEAINK